MTASRYYDMPRYMRGKRRFDEANTLGERMAAGEDMKQDCFKTVAAAQEWAERDDVKAWHGVSSSTK